jgi:hypothetical protein
MTQHAERPTWLTIQQHALIGELRAKTLLAERFIILDRSLDVQGADFLIHGLDLRRNVVGRDPPRFGIVQAKLIQDSRTDIRVPEIYLREGSRILDEFFLIVSTGLAGNDRMFLLSARDLIDKCPIVQKGKEPSRLLTGRSLLETPSEFEVFDKRRALDRIEQALEKADSLAANDRYLPRSVTLFRSRRRGR